MIRLNLKRRQTRAKIRLMRGYGPVWNRHGHAAFFSQRKGQDTVRDSRGQLGVNGRVACTSPRYGIPVSIDELVLGFDIGATTSRCNPTHFGEFQRDLIVSIRHDHPVDNVIANQPLVK